MKYFWKPVNGTNADILRHTKEQQKLEEKIRELELIEKPTMMDERLLRTYRNFLHLLLLSKAEVVSNMGKNKKL